MNLKSKTIHAIIIMADADATEMLTRLKHFFLHFEKTKKVWALFCYCRANFLKTPYALFKALITLEWVMSRENCAHIWNPQCCSFPTMPVACLWLYHIKLLPYLYFQNCQNCNWWMLVQCTNWLITFDRIKSQKRYRHHWKDESCSFPTMSVAFLHLQAIKSYKLWKFLILIRYIDRI